MATRIYVGRLPYSMTNQELADLFTPFGEVTEANMVMDRETGRAKGFAFVEMIDADAARTAIAQLDGTVQGTQTIRVNEAQPRPTGHSDRPRRDSADRERRW